MALSRTDLLGAISGASGTFGTGAYTTSPFTPPNNCLLVAGVSAIENGGSTPLLTDLTIADSAGLTWTNRVEQSAATAFSTGTRIWTAPVTTGTSMTITLDCGTRDIAEYSISVVAYTGYNTTTPTGATATGSQVGGFSGPPTPASITLSPAPAATSEVFAVVGMDKNTADCTPGSTFTEIHDVENTNWGGLESEARTGSTSTTVDWTDMRPNGGAIFNYAAVAVEIKAFTGNVTTSDTVTVTDAATRTLVLPRTTSDTLTTTDTLTRTAVLARTTTDTVTITDSLASSTLRDLIVTIEAPAPKWQVRGPTVLTFPAVSLEYVRVPVLALVGGVPVNPVGDTVRMAFLSLETSTPSSGDWQTASWDTAPTTGGRYLAQCLVGPGGTITLTAGTWWVWIKITDTPEVPIRQAGFIVVT